MECSEKERKKLWSENGGEVGYNSKIINDLEIKKDNNVDFSSSKNEICSKCLKWWKDWAKYPQPQPNRID